MTPLLGAAAGAILMAGVLVAIVALNPDLIPDQGPRPPRRTRPGHRWWQLRSRRERVLAVVGVVVGVVLAALDGWVVALVLAPVIAVGLPRLMTYERGVDPDQLEAIEEWVRTLSGVLQAEAALSTAIVATLPSTPAAIKEPVTNLVTRLQARRPLNAALYEFADDLNSQTGDYVAGALLQASSVSGAGLTTTLSAIATEVAAEVRVRRSIAVERERAINQARWVTGISVALIIVTVLGTSMGQAYRDALGQLILLGMSALFAGALLMVRRRAGTTPAPRFLIQPGGQT